MGMQQYTIQEIASIVEGILLQGDKQKTIATITTNSKEETHQGLFIPICGERVDGHDFIEDAAIHGAIATLTSKHKSLKDLPQTAIPIAYISVKDTKIALQKLAAYHRKQFDIPVIGITGSVGKTTTKEMIATALSAKYRVCKTKGNQNSQIGVPLTLLQIEPEDEIAVVEMGISMPGEMLQLSEMVQPTDAVITNIGVAHLANFQTREAILKEKCRCIQCSKRPGNLYVNGADERLKQMKQPGWNVITYGAEENLYFAKNIQFSQAGITFSWQAGTEEEVITLHTLGKHAIENAVVAMAIAKQYHVPLRQAAQALETYQPLPGRGQVNSVAGILWIDDTYNASPDTMQSGIMMLEQLTGVKRKVAVLADMLELGAYSQQAHRQVGQWIATKTLDLVVAIGKEAAMIYQGIQETKQNCVRESRYFKDQQEACDFLQAYLQKHDAVFLKGSHGMHLENLLKSLQAIKQKE